MKMFQAGKWLLMIGFVFALTACGGGGGGGGSTDNTPVTETGAFVDSAVSNIKYQTVTQSGYTNGLGEFKYIAGETVTFSIGDIKLPPAAASSRMTPLTLVGTSSSTDTAEVNISRLLQTLDDDGDPTNGITIGIAAHTAAAGMTVDFNSATFDNDVQSLVTKSGSITTILVSSTDAVAHLEDTLASTPGGKFGMKVYKPTDECNPDGVSYITGLDGNPEPITISGWVGGSITPYYYNELTNSITEGIPVEVADSVDVDIGNAGSGSDSGGPYTYQLLFESLNEYGIRDGGSEKLYRIDWNVYPYNSTPYTSFHSSYPTHCIRSGSSQIDYDGQLKNIVIQWNSTDNSTGGGGGSTPGTLTLSSPFSSLSSQSYVYDPVISEPNNHIWKVGTPQVAAAQMQIDIVPETEEELLMFYVYEGDGTSGAHIYAGDNSYSCMLSGTSTYVSSCSSLGITVDRSAGTISFVSTPLHSYDDNSIRITGTMNGSLTFAPF